MSNDPSLDDLADEAAELDGYFSDAPLDLQPKYPQLHTGMDNALVVLNLPKVPEAKVEKLTKVLMKLLSRIGNLATTDTFSGFHMPFQNDSTLGFCMVAYETKEEADKAVIALQNYALDKNHSLTVIPFERAMALQELVPSSFQEPEPAPFVERPNPTSWLEDANQRDSYVIRHGRETQVQWWDTRQGSDLDYDGSREKAAGVLWCEQYCFWSPKGSYLATLVPARGVILWSGAQYEKSGRFMAPGVKRILFSPQENYLLTCNEDPRDPEAIKIYHIPTERLLRAFPLYPEDMPKDRPPPPFLWSHDDKYIACLGNGLIRIYETPGMRLLDQRSLAAEGVAEFQWSPTDNVLAYWVRYSCLFGVSLSSSSSHSSV
jgi:translation initiation factor 3 subunit B